MVIFSFSANCFASFVGLTLNAMRIALDALAKVTSVSVSIPISDKIIFCLTSACLIWVIAFFIASDEPWTSDFIIILSSSETSASSYQWYNCTNSLIIAGATGTNFSVSATADYAVIISKSGCLDTTNCTNVFVTGSSGTPPTNLWGNQYALNAQFYKVDKNGNSYLVGDFLPH